MNPPGPGEMPTLSRPMSLGVGHRPDGHQRVAGFDHAAVGEEDLDALFGALDAVGARLLRDGRAALREDLLEHGGGVGVLVREHAVAAGDDGDLDAHLGVGGRELGAGDAGADHGEVLGQLLQLVELAPVEDALAVGHRAGQDARGGAGGDQDDVGRQLLGALGRRHGDLVGREAGLFVAEAGFADDDADAFALDAGADVGGLGQREALDPAVHGREVDAGVGQVGVDAELAEVVHLRQRARARDERLRRDAVVEDAGAAQAVPLDDRDVGPVLGCDQRGFVAGRAPAHDHDPGHLGPPRSACVRCSHRTRRR